MEQRSRQRVGRASGAQVPMSQDIFAEEYDDVWPTRTPSSTRRYRSDVKSEVGRAPADVQGMVLGERKQIVPARRTASVPGVSAGRRRIDTEDIIYRQGDASPKRRLHWLFYLSLAICIMLVGWFVVSIVTNWWRVVQDDWRYGRPRTYQTEYVVGHNDSKEKPSHFIALNLDRQIQVIEFPGGDSTKAKVYLGPILVGEQQELAPVTLEFRDVTEDGKVDMIVTVQDSHFIFVNEKDQFRPPASDEDVQP